MDRRTILDNLELAMLTIDELVDGGTILETDSQAITNRVMMRGVSEARRELKKKKVLIGIYILFL